MNPLKFFIVIFSLSLFGACASAWAEGVEEPVYPPYCWVQPPNQKLWYQCDTPEVKMLECLNLMELAMTEVDPYLDSMSLPETKRDKVLKLWNRAKNTCWTELKDLQPQHYH